jgi:hypothetical protein
LRPIVWGLIVSIIGAFFWILFSVVFGIVGGLSGKDIGAGYWGLIYITGLAMIFGIPSGIVGEGLRWYRGKKASKTVTPQAHPSSVPSVAVSQYCHLCGTQVEPGSRYCDRCGVKLLHPPS